MHYLFDHPEKVLSISTLLFVLLAMTVEIIVSILKKLKFYDVRDTVTNLTMYLGYVAINSLWLPIAYSIYMLVHQHSIFKFGEQWWLFQGNVPAWHWLLLFVLDDFCFYIFHRTSHKVRILWASHMTHHSSEQFNLSVGFRQTWLPFFSIIFWIPLAFIGFEPLMIMTMQLLSLFIQALLHTRVIKSFGPLDLILNSPSHHRVHHGTQDQYIDKNFGGVLIVWDRIFRTFEKEVEPPKFGLGLPEPIYNPLNAAFYEFKTIIKEIPKNGVSTVAESLLRPPGWKRHD